MDAVEEDALPRIAIEIDRQLHARRVTSDRPKRTHAANLDDLPDGVFVLPGAERTPRLIAGGTRLAWAADGYTALVVRRRGAKVEALTPEHTATAIHNGYVPEMHPSTQVLLDRRT